MNNEARVTKSIKMKPSIVRKAYRNALKLAKHSAGGLRRQ